MASASLNEAVFRVQEDDSYEFESTNEDPELDEYSTELLNQREFQKSTGEEMSLSSFTRKIDIFDGRLG